MHDHARALQMLYVAEGIIASFECTHALKHVMLRVAECEGVHKVISYVMLYVAEGIIASFECTHALKHVMLPGS